MHLYIYIHTWKQSFVELQVSDLLLCHKMSINTESQAQNIVLVVVVLGTRLVTSQVCAFSYQLFDRMYTMCPFAG